jgi:PAS domain S-box-containing protein
MLQRLLRPGPYAVLHIVIVTAGVTVAYATGAVAPALLTTVCAGLLVHTIEQIRQRRIQVAAREEAEARYRTLVEQLPLITYMDSPHSTDEAAAYVSPQVESVLGYTREEWHADASFFIDHLHPEDRDRVRELQRASRESGEPLEIEYRFLTKDGRYVWLRDSYTIVRDGDGNPWYSQGFALDVTARIEAQRDREALLAQAQLQNERLRELDRMKDEFIALVSHELRTPLTSIRGYLELLTDESEQPGLRIEQQTWLQVIGRNAERLLALVEDLLLSAQAHAGTLALARSNFDLARVVRQCALASAPAASARGIQLLCSADSALPISGDPTRIGQVIDNLVSNALKFTPAGGRVELRASQHDGDARIEVADTGMGIPAAEQRHLFDRFFRAERAQAEAIAGAGLGLTIAKAIVDAHNGRIGYTSTEGSGTTFTVDLPAAGGS